MVSIRMRTRPAPNRKGITPPTPSAGRKRIEKITAKHDTITLSSTREFSREARFARFIVSHRDPGVKSFPLFDMEQATMKAKQISAHHFLLNKKKKAIERGRGHVAPSIERTNEIIHDARLLEGALELSGKKRLPTVYEVAALGFLKHHGLTSEFRRYVLRMHSLYVHHKSKLWWSGSPQPLQEILLVEIPGTKNKFIEAVERLLKKEKNEALTTSEIAAKLEIPLSVKVQRDLAIALNLLQAAHVSKTQPNSVVKTGSSPIVSAKWSHAGNKNPKVNYENPSLAFLLKLKAGPVTMKGTDYRALKNLVENKAIERTTQFNQGSRVTSPYVLTEKTRNELDAYEQTGELSERLRRIITIRSKKVQRKRAA